MSIWTVMITVSFQVAGKARVWRDISQDVQSGSFATLINKPVSYAAYHFARYAGSIAPSLAFSLLVGGLVTYIIVGPTAVSFIGIIAAIPAFILGLTLSFLLWFCVGLTALWLEDATPLTWIISKMTVVFGGLVIPIALLPNVARQIAETLPFASLFALPSQLVFAFNADRWMHVVGTQVLWCFALGTLASFMFVKGRRYVASNGG